MQVLQEAEGEAAKLAGGVAPVVLALTGAAAGQRPGELPGDVHRQVPDAIDQDCSIGGGRQNQQPPAGVILDDRGLGGL